MASAARPGMLRALRGARRRRHDRGGRGDHLAPASTRLTGSLPRACSSAAGRPTARPGWACSRPSGGSPASGSRRSPIGTRFRAPLPLLPGTRSTPRHRPGAPRGGPQRAPTAARSRTREPPCALEWTLALDTAGPALELSAALGEYWMSRDRCTGAAQFIERALSMPGAGRAHELRVRVLCNKAWAMWPLGRRAELGSDPARRRDPAKSGSSARTRPGAGRARRWCSRRPWGYGRVSTRWRVKAPSEIGRGTGSGSSSRTTPDGPRGRRHGTSRRRSVDGPPPERQGGPCPRRRTRPRPGTRPPPPLPAALPSTADVPARPPART
jgi:hypothetical protein